MDIADLISLLLCVSNPNFYCEICLAVLDQIYLPVHVSTLNTLPRVFVSKAKINI